MPTVKLEAVNVPEAVTVHAGAVATTAGVIVQTPTSAGANPLPVTVTVMPTGPELGVRAIVGDAVETVKLA